MIQKTKNKQTNKKRMYLYFGTGLDILRAQNRYRQARFFGHTYSALHQRKMKTLDMQIFSQIGKATKLLQST